MVRVADSPQSSIDLERLATAHGLRDTNAGLRRQVGRLLAPVAPTATVGVTFAASTISGSVLYPLTDSAFRLLCGLTLANPTVSNSVNYYRYPYTGLNNTPNAQSGLASFAFITDADQIEVSWYADSYWNVRVDGQWAFPTLQHTAKSNGERYLTLVDFGSAGLRELVFVGQFLTNGVRVGPKYGIYPPLSIPAKPTVVACLADSYGQQLLNVNYGSFAYGFCSLMGWDDLRLAAIGGTGYLNPNNGTGPYATYRDHAQVDILSANPDVILVCGGINDQGRQTKATLQVETTLLFAMLRAGAPQARIIATGPWAPTATLAASSNYTDVRDAILGGLQTISGPWLFVDNLSGLVTRHDGVTIQQPGPWITGTGKVGSPANNGNADRYISSDGTHPPPDGSDYLGVRLAAAVTAALPL